MKHIWGRFLCLIGFHKEEIAEEFPSETTTILGVICLRHNCRRIRCTVNGRIPRCPSKAYGDSVTQAKAWIEGRSGSKVGRDFVTFS